MTKCFVGCGISGRRDVFRIGVPAASVFGMALGVRALAASLWTVYPYVRVPDRNGNPDYSLPALAGPHQLTNVLSLTEWDDTISVQPGTYDFTGIAMTIDGVVTNHLCVGDKSFAIVGDTEGRWDDKVVFKGDGRCIRANWWKRVSVNNVTFEGFNAGSQSSGCQGGSVLFRSDVASQVLSNCVFRGCSAYEGGAVFGGVLSDCLFTNCAAVANGGALSTVRSASMCRFADNRAGESGGGVYKMTTAASNVPVILDSQFAGNACANRGGAAYLDDSTVSNCTFESNVSLGHAGALAVMWEKAVDILDCDFKDNTASNGVGGAVFFEKNVGGLVRGCTFSGNMTVSDNQQNTRWQGGAISSGPSVNNSAYPAIDVRDSTFTGNFGGDAGGAVANGDCSNCVFRSNRALKWGSGICLGSATDCTFVNNIRDDPRGIDTYFHIEYGGNDAYGSRLLRCDMDGGCYSECSIAECRIHDVTNSRSACVFWGRNWVTNCLVTSGSGTGLSRGMFYRYHDKPAETSIVVNCTFVDNELSNAGMYHADNGVNVNNYLLLNSIFYGNTCNGAAADLRGSSIASGPVYSNCLFGASSYESTVGWKDAGGNMLGANPMFAQEERADKFGVDPYSLRLSSPAIGKGDASCFTAESVDLAGNLRLKGGVLDLGCFQCYMPCVATIIMVR